MVGSKPGYEHLDSTAQSHSPLQEDLLQTPFARRRCFASGLILEDLGDKVGLVFKNVIAPVQAWLLSQGRCVGCGVDLTAGKVVRHTQGQKVVCKKCGRIFIKESQTGKYRRALFEEV